MDDWGGARASRAVSSALAGNTVIGIVSAKLNASAALAASGVPQGGMNYAVKSPAWRD